MNQTAKILTSISPEGSAIEDILVNAGRTLLPTYLQIEALARMLETFERTELVTLTREGGRVVAARLTMLGHERATEVITGRDRCPACIAAKGEK